jgi:hypothetical protein
MDLKTAYVSVRGLQQSVGPESVGPIIVRFFASGHRSGHSMSMIRFSRLTALRTGYSILPCHGSCGLNIRVPFTTLSIAVTGAKIFSSTTWIVTI